MIHRDTDTGTRSSETKYNVGKDCKDCKNRREQSVSPVYMTKGAKLVESMMIKLSWAMTGLIVFLFLSILLHM